MSWDAYFDGNSWNYTHNTNRMIAAALATVGIDTPPCGGSLGGIIGPAWWDALEGKSAAEGYAYLDTIIQALAADPEKYRAMNPENGWGSYGGLLDTLRSMRDASVAHPDPRWSVSG